MQARAWVAAVPWSVSAPAWHQRGPLQKQAHNWGIAQVGIPACCPTVHCKRFPQLPFSCFPLTRAVLGVKDGSKQGPVSLLGAPELAEHVCIGTGGSSKRRGCNRWGKTAGSRQQQQATPSRQSPGRATHEQAGQRAACTHAGWSVRASEGRRRNKRCCCAAAPCQSGAASWQASCCRACCCCHCAAHCRGPPRRQPRRGWRPRCAHRPRRQRRCRP